MCYVSVDVRRHPQGPEEQFPPGPRDVDVHPLAGGHGVRVLLRLVHPAAARGAAAGGAVVPAQPQRPRVQPHPGGQSSYLLIYTRFK